jgi:hypothetical protein
MERLSSKISKDLEGGSQAYFKTLYQHLPGHTTETHKKKPQPGYSGNPPDI